MKKIFLSLTILVFIFLITGCKAHIEDTNGPDNYSLETFSEEDKVSSGWHITVGSISSQVGGKGKFSAKKFTGVYTLYETYVSTSNSCYFDIEVESGNLEVVLIQDAKIIKSVDLNTTSRFTIDTKGKVSLRVIGESAKFSITYEFTKNEF